MNPGIIKLAAAALLVLLTLHGVARGESNEALVQRGNAAYGQGNFDEALALYDEASVTAPESPQIHFNRGAVHYQKEDYAEAIDAFKVAALRSKDLTLSAQAKFNLGNCAFRNAQRQRDSDLKKAIEHCEESISYYQEAHGMDSEFSKAAENIEIVRLYVKVLLDEQKKQQEQEEQEQEQQNDLVKKLKELIERQNALMAENEGLRTSRPNAVDPAANEAWREALTALTGKESTLRDDTGKLLVEMRQTVEQIRQQAAGGGGAPGAAPGAPPQPSRAEATGFAEKVEEASGHVGNAMIDEQLAQDELAAARQEAALSHQTNAVKDLEEAVKVLSQEQEQQQQQQSDDQQQDQDQQDQEDQDQEDQGDQQEQKPEDGEEQEDEQDQEPQDGEPDPDQQEEPEQRAAESAEDILDEEKENQKERQPARPGRIKPVDKDW
jgi:hypothetical protein